MKKISKFIEHPLFTGSALVIVGTMSVNTLNYLYHVIIGRMLGPSGYGELVALISVASLLGILPSSLNLVVIKYVSSTKEKAQLNDLIGWLRIRVFQFSLLFFTLILLVSPFLTSFLHISNITYLWLIALSSLFALLSTLNRAIMQGLLMFKQMIYSIFLENIGKLLITLILVYLSFYLFGAMVALVISAGLGCYLSFAYLKFKTKKRLRRPPLIKKMVLFAVPVMIQSFSTASLYTSDLILVKHFFSSYEAGIYAALSTLGKIIFFGAGPISAVMFPLISQKASRGENYKDIFKYSFITTLMLSTVVLAIYWIFPDLAINLLYGKDYHGASHMLVWFGIFITLFTLSSLLVNYSLSVGKTRVVFFPLVAALVQVLLIYLFHENLMMVILISVFVTALLLVILLIYSTYGKSFTKRNKINFSYSTDI